MWPNTTLDYNLTKGAKYTIFKIRQMFSMNLLVHETHASNFTALFNLAQCDGLAMPFNVWKQFE